MPMKSKDEGVDPNIKLNKLLIFFFFLNVCNPIFKISVRPKECIKTIKHVP